MLISLKSFAGEIDNHKVVLSIYKNYTGTLRTAASPLTGPESLRASLYLLNSNNTTALADGVLIEFNNLYHDSVYLEDAYKFTNIGENLGLIRYGTVLSVERRPIIAMTDTLYFKLWKTTIRDYQLGFVMVNLDHPGMQAFLEDAYLGNSLPLALNGTTKVNFSINTDRSSSNENRFKIVYKKIFAPAAPLPVSFTSVAGYQQNNKITINWKVENESNIEKYEVEHSVDGIEFNKLSTMSVKSGASPFGNYSVIDNQPFAGNNFYRIRSVDFDGSKKLSQIIKITTGKIGKGSFTIFPNPILGNMVNLQFTNQPAGIYRIRVINYLGQAVYSTTVTSGGGNISYSLSINGKFKTGIYQLEIKLPDDTFQIKKMMVRE